MYPGPGKTGLPPAAWPQVHVDLSDIPVPPPPPWPPQPVGRGLVEIVSASYGANCNPDRAANFSCELDAPGPSARRAGPTAEQCAAALSTACDGKPRCNFTVATPSRDPCPFKDKHFSVLFRCSSSAESPIHNNTLEGEASGVPIFLQCA